MDDSDANAAAAYVRDADGDESQSVLLQQPRLLHRVAVHVVGAVRQQDHEALPRGRTGRGSSARQQVAAHPHCARRVRVACSAFQRSVV